MVCLMRRVESPAVFLTEQHLPSTTYGAPVTEQHIQNNRENRGLISWLDCG